MRSCAKPWPRRREGSRTGGDWWIFGWLVGLVGWLGTFGNIWNILLVGLLGIFFFVGRFWEDGFDWEDE